MGTNATKAPPVSELGGKDLKLDHIGEVLGPKRSPIYCLPQQEPKFRTKRDGCMKTLKEEQRNLEKSTESLQDHSRRVGTMHEAISSIAGSPTPTPTPSLDPQQGDRDGGSPGRCHEDAREKLIEIHPPRPSTLLSLPSLSDPSTPPSHSTEELLRGVTVTGEDQSCKGDLGSPREGIPRVTSVYVSVTFINNQASPLP